MKSKQDGSGKKYDYQTKKNKHKQNRNITSLLKGLNPDMSSGMDMVDCQCYLC